MARAAGLCGKCGGPRRGRAARKSDAVADCSLCQVALCARHSRWDPDASQYVCTRCARTHSLRVIKGGG